MQGVWFVEETLVGKLFVEGTLVGRWSANRIARDDGSVPNDVFRSNVGGGCGLWKEHWKMFSQKKTVQRQSRHQSTGTSGQIKVAVML